MSYLGWWKGKNNKIVLIERQQFKKVGDIYYAMELVVRKELKYVGLKLCNFSHKYIWAFQIYGDN
jgi:hypothetical protein